MVDILEPHILAIRERGLRVEDASGHRVVETLHAFTDVAEVGASDLVIIATKASDAGAAAVAARFVLQDDTIVLAMQNGLGAGGRVAAHVPVDNVLVGVAQGFGATIEGPGHVHHHNMDLIRIGEMHGGLTPRVERVVAVWRDAGFRVRGYEDIDQLIWEKFICNVTFSAPCTVFGSTIGEVMSDPHAWNIALTCGLEADAVARAKGIALSFDDAGAYVSAFGDKVRSARPSMLSDHLANRPSEIDVINGMVPVVAAAEAGTAAPFNEVLTGIVKSREADFKTS